MPEPHSIEATLEFKDKEIKQLENQIESLENEINKTEVALNKICNYDSKDTSKNSSGLEQPKSGSRLVYFLLLLACF